MSKCGVLHFFCGKMAAGKSTKAVQLLTHDKTVLISEDEWLKALFLDEIKTLNDYINYSARLKPLLLTHIQQLLLSGMSVVLDFPGNTVNQRAWFKEIYSENNFPHILHYIEASDELCLKQLAVRSKNNIGEAFTTEKEFHVINKYFQAPSENEGFNIHLHVREDV